jgi:hypothetical protein
MFKRLITVFILLSGFLAVNFSVNLVAQDSNQTSKKTNYKKARVLQTSTAKKSYKSGRSP